MPLDSILAHILKEAQAEREKIIQAAEEERKKIIQQAAEEAEKIYQQILEQEKARLENTRQKEIVNARLEARKKLLFAKRRLLDSVFNQLKSEIKKERLKKKQVGFDKTEEASEDIDFYLKQIQPEYEAELAAVLFA